MRQEIRLDVSFVDRTIYGVSRLTVFVPKADSSIKLNFRQGVISSIFVNGDVAKYEHRSALDKVIIDPSTGPVSRDSLAFLNAYSEAMSSSIGGELEIFLPPVDDMDIDENEEERCIKLEISYFLQNPASGLVFIESDLQSNSVYLVTQNQPESARNWFPCFDSPNYRCPFSIEVSVPFGMTAFCSGDKDDEIVDEEARKVRIRYGSTMPVTASAIGLVAGIFTSASMSSAGGNFNCSCPPASKAMLLPSTLSLSFLSTEVKDFFGATPPTSTTNIVFAPGPSRSVLPLFGLILFSEGMMHGAQDIDANQPMRESLALALASQYFGVFVSPKSWSDLWLVMAISQHVANTILSKIFGSNELKFKLIEDVELACSLDADGIPLHILGDKVSGALRQHCKRTTEGLTHPAEQFDLLRRVKAPLVIRIFQKRLGLPLFRQSLENIVRASLEANGEEGQGCLGRVISVSSFFKLFKNIDDFDVEAFVQQWVLGSGCPSFLANCIPVRKKPTMEAAIRVANAADVVAVTKDRIRVKPIYNIKIKIVEVEGNPYVKRVDVVEECGVTEFPVRSRMRESRERKKAMKSRQAALGAVVSTNQNQLEIIDLSLHPVSGNIRWIRVDGDFLFVRRLQVTQTLPMWLHQLQCDGDIGGQIEALKALVTFRDRAVVSALNATMTNKKIFHRVRGLACELLGEFSKSLDSGPRDGGGLTEEEQAAQTLADEAMLLIFRFAVDSHYDDKDLFPLPNDFRDLSEYMVHLKLIQVLGNVGSTSHSSAPNSNVQFAFQLLCNHLTHNDNSRNLYSDSTLIELLIQSAVRTVYDSNSALLLKAQIERYIEVDGLFPSHNRKVTVACLKGLADLQSRMFLPLNFDIFFKFAKSDNPIWVRSGAIECLCQFSLTHTHLAPPLLFLVSSDPHPALRGAILLALTRELSRSRSAPLIATVYASSHFAKTFCNTLWNLFNESCTFDILLQQQAFSLYSFLFPRHPPPCFGLQLRPTTLKIRSNPISAPPPPVAPPPAVAPPPIAPSVVSPPVVSPPIAPPPTAAEATEPLPGPDQRLPESVPAPEVTPTAFVAAETSNGLSPPLAPHGSPIHSPSPAESFSQASPAFSPPPDTYQHQQHPTYSPEIASSSSAKLWTNPCRDWPEGYTLSVLVVEPSIRLVFRRGKQRKEKSKSHTPMQLPSETTQHHFSSIRTPDVSGTGPALATTTQHASAISDESGFKSPPQATGFSSQDSSPFQSPLAENPFHQQTYSPPAISADLLCTSASPSFTASSPSSSLPIHRFSKVRFLFSGMTGPQKPFVISSAGHTRLALVMRADDGSGTTLRVPCPTWDGRTIGGVHIKSKRAKKISSLAVTAPPSGLEQGAVLRNLEPQLEETSYPEVNVMDFMEQDDTGPNEEEGEQKDAFMDDLFQ